MTYPRPEHRLFEKARVLIGGGWSDVAPEQFTHRNPSTGEVLGSFPAGSRDQIEQAIRAAETALRGWRDQPPTKRRKVLLKAVELVCQRGPEHATNATHETVAEFNPMAPGAAAEHLGYHIGWADKTDVAPRRDLACAHRAGGRLHRRQQLSADAGPIRGFEQSGS